MQSEKLITMMSGVITLRNMLSLKPNQPSVPSASRIAIKRRAGGDHHERHAPEEHDRDQAAGEEAEAVVDAAGRARPRCAVRAGSPARRSARPSRPNPRDPRDRLADLADDVPRACALDDLRIEREHHEREPPVVRQQFAADDLVRRHALDQLLIGGAGRQGLGEQRRRNLAGFRRLPRRKQRDQPARRRSVAGR